MVDAWLGKISNIYLSRTLQHFRDKFTKIFYFGGRCNAELNYLKFVAFNRTIQPLLLNINKWNLKVLISDFLFFVFQFHIHLPNYRFGNTLYSPPKIKVSSKFIFWATNSFFGSLRKNQIRKFSVNFGLFGIKSVHDQPDSPSWYTDSWPYIAPSREELHCQSCPCCWSTDLTERELPTQYFKNVEVYAD